jgi:hypothetical protein
MSFITLRNEIEAVIGYISDTLYLRANEGEANMAIDKMNIDGKCLCIHIDRTTMTANRSSFGYVYKVVPTEILFVYKNTKLDDKQTEIDTMIDNAEAKADEFYDRIIQSAVINDVAALPGYSLDRLEGFKRFDAILSGVLFTCDLPINKNYYYCPDIPN